VADDGEVEDYRIFLDRRQDFGDAPAPYPVLASEDGARHLLGPVMWLGAKVDGELDGQPNENAEGDDLNGEGWPGDEDGVFVRDEGGLYQSIKNASIFQANGWYPLGVVASTNGYLNAWIDFNADGDWADAGEQVFTDVPLVPGTNALALHIPVSAVRAQSYARFRFDSQGGLAATGSADDGEVEDYRVALREVLKMASCDREADGTVILEWNDLGLLYTIEQTTNLMVPDSWEATPGIWPLQTNRWTIPNLRPDPAIYFRVLGE
jgi:hypothetical protein